MRPNDSRRSSTGCGSGRPVGGALSGGPAAGPARTIGAEPVDVEGRSWVEAEDRHERVRDQFGDLCREADGFLEPPPRRGDVGSVIAERGEPALVLDR